MNWTYVYWGIIVYLLWRVMWYKIVVKTSALITKEMSKKYKEQLDEIKNLKEQLEESK